MGLNTYDELMTDIYNLNFIFSYTNPETRSTKYLNGPLTNDLIKTVHYIKTAAWRPGAGLSAAAERSHQQTASSSLASRQTAGHGKV